LTDRLTFGVKRLVFEVWPAAGASQQARPVEIHVAVRSKQDSGQAKQDTLCGKAGQRIRGAS
jgi:hypothetical protein